MTEPLKIKTDYSDLEASIIGGEITIEINVDYYSETESASVHCALPPDEARRLGQWLLDRAQSEERAEVSLAPTDFHLEAIKRMRANLARYGWNAVNDPTRPNYVEIDGDSWIDLGELAEVALAGVRRVESAK